MAVYYYDNTGAVVADWYDETDDLWVNEVGAYQESLGYTKLIISGPLQENKKVENGILVDDMDKIRYRQEYLIRNERDLRLKNDVDQIVTNPFRWADMTAEQQQAWATYRQALLDIPQQAGFPTDITWPTKPE